MTRRGTSDRLDEQLIAQLQDNGGTLRIEDPDPETRAAYRRAIHAAKQRGLVPTGFQLRHTGRNAGDLIMQLADAAAPDDTEWNRIRLGARDQVSKQTDLVDLVRAHPEVLDVSDSVRSRALDLIAALADTAERRGHKLAMSKKRTKHGLYLQIDQRRYPVTIKEQYAEVARTRDSDDSAGRRYSWQRVPEILESVPSGRLAIALQPSQHGERSEWADRGRSVVENKLRDVIKEVERRAEAEERAREEAQRRHEEYLARQEREQAEREAQWTAAMADARKEASVPIGTRSSMAHWCHGCRPMTYARSVTHWTQHHNQTCPPSIRNVYLPGSRGHASRPIVSTLRTGYHGWPMRTSTRTRAPTSCDRI